MDSTHFSRSEPVIYRMLQFYIGGHIGFAEMQLELIAALAALADEQSDRLSKIALSSWPPMPNLMKEEDR